MNQNYFSGKKKITALVAVLLFIIFPSVSFSQLIVNPGGTPQQIVSALASTGLTITNITLNCGTDDPVTGSYGTFNGSSSNIGLGTGVLLTSGLATNAVGPNNSNSATGSTGVNISDPQITGIEPLATHDLCILEFDVVPHCSFMELRFVFGSEEYPEFVNSGFNDAFGFFVTGPDASCNPGGYSNTNVAILAGGTPASIDNINAGYWAGCPLSQTGCTNCAYYVNNCGGTTVQYDGFTTPIVVDLNVCPCATYHWKFAIADAGDGAYDSGVFIDYLTCTSPFAYNLATTQAACGGVCDGTAAVNITTGTPPYTFHWSTGETTQSITGLCPGNYSVDVMDAISCGTPITQNFTIIGSPAMNIFSVQNNVTCHGGTNGSVALDSVTGGVTPLHYLWSSGPNDTLTSVNGLSAGPYTVIITDAYNCTSSQTLTITEPPLLTATISPLPTNVSCNGGSNGSASVIGGGGTGAYSYLWTSTMGVIGTTATVNGLIAGNYNVVITDANGCTSLTSTTITEPTVVTAVINPPTNVSCNGGSNGSATAVAGGGTGAYNYVWTSSIGIVGTTATAGNLNADIYTVLITDANGCTQSASITITEPTALTAAINPPTNVSCNAGSNGSATVVPAGGTGAYTYVWTSSLGIVGTTATASNLNADNYNVLISDANGCTQSVSTTITEPTAVTAVIDPPMNVSCNAGNDGSLNVVGGGGMGGYGYVWTSSMGLIGTTATVNGLIAGNYSVIITDANGCTQSASAIITEPTVVTAVINPPTNVSCNGGNNGSATVVAGGGTGAYNYVWTSSLGIVGTTATADNLNADNYNVLVTDANGCTQTATILVTEPSLLTLAVAGSTTICISQSTYISALGNGGTAPLSYSWDNSVNTFDQTVSPSTTTTYTVTVTDANGCSPSPQSVLVTVNPPLNVNAAATPAICFGSTASISSSAGGGNGGPYSYSWNNGAITNANATVTPDHDTTFTVEINDGCSPPVQTTVNIIVNALPVAVFSPLTAEGCPPLSVSFTDNSITTANSNYLWSFGDNTSSGSQNPSHVYYETGVYDVSLTVGTPEGCIDTLSLQNVVTVLDVPTAMFSMSEPEISMYNPVISFTDLSSGAAWWNWNFGDGAGTSDNPSPAYRYNEAGIYTIQLIVENNVGCFDTTYSVLRVQNEITLYVPTGFTPNGDGVNDNFLAYGIGISEFDMWVYDRWGTQVFHTSDREHPWNGNHDGDGKACQNDVYVYKIKYKDVEGKLHDYVGHVTLVR